MNAGNTNVKAQNYSRGGKRIANRQKLQQQNPQARTENGELAIGAQQIISGSIDDCLMAMNFQLVTKSDFDKVKPYFENILNNGDEKSKILSLTLLFHFRDIEEGKGLRNPFIEGLLYIYEKFPQFVHECVPHIPKYGYYKDLCRLFLESDTLKLEELKLVLVENFIKKLRQEHDKGKIVNCAKFAPREKKKYSQFAFAISKKMFPESKTQLKDYRLYLQETYKNYAQITEVLMCQGKWAEIEPKYVPSICFQRYKKAFLDPKPEKKENEDRKAIKEKFTQHIKNAVQGKEGAKINAKRLFVNELIVQMEKYMHKTDEQLTEEDKILKLALEAQMKDIIADIEKNGKLFKENIAVMADVSGSMSGIPMNVSIGLGLIISQINKHPQFGQRIMTFHENPQWQDVSQCTTLFEKAKTIKNAPWGCSTNFYGAMELLVQTATKEEDIPKVLFVLSDMQFNQADGQAGKPGTGYDRFVDLFKKHGYSKESIPVIVFWNLRGTETFVVDSSVQGAICIAGYSQSLLKSIMNAPDVEYLKYITPFMFVKDLLEGKRYQVIRDLAAQFCFKKDKMEVESPNKEEFKLNDEPQVNKEAENN